MKNNSFAEISSVILNSNNILLYPHINIDGDTLGSSVALCKAIRQLGKECYILIEDDIPRNLKFLDRGYCTKDQNVIEESDLSICVDCGDKTRFPKRAEKFSKAPKSICIDHHKTNDMLCTYNYVDPAAAATGLLIYELLQEMKITVDKEMGEAIFAAITTDTGNFQYSNTSKETHRIVGELYDAGIDANGVSVELYENKRIERILISGKVISTLELFCDGKCVIAYVTQDMLKECNALMEETEEVVQTLRSISGVEVAAFVKEQDKETAKISLRSKHYADVAEIAASFNGGGHSRAAGATVKCGIKEAVQLLKERITESMVN